MNIRVKIITFIKNLLPLIATIIGTELGKFIIAILRCYFQQ